MRGRFSGRRRREEGGRTCGWLKRSRFLSLTHIRGLTRERRLSGWPVGPEVNLLRLAFIYIPPLIERQKVNCGSRVISGRRVRKGKGRRKKDGSSRAGKEGDASGSVYDDEFRFRVMEVGKIEIDAG